MIDIEQIRQSATDDEVFEAVTNLTDKEKQRLGLYAVDRLQNIGRAAAGWDEEDLLQEAIKRTLAGNRKWYKGQVDFFGHLKGVLMSITSDMARKLTTEKHEEPFSESELLNGSEEESVNPYEVAASAPSRVLQTLVAKERLALVMDIFRDDQAVLNIIEGRCCDLTEVETCEMFEMTQKEFGAARRRLSRGLATVFPEGIAYER